MQLNRVAMLPIAVVVAAFLSAPASFSQVVINEIMQNPEFAGDTDGEWFELFNSGVNPVDINGWTIKDDGTNDHVIDAPSSLVIEPGDFLVLGRNADPNINGGVPVDYSYGTDITFGNASDQLVLVDPDGVERDRVGYDDGLTFPDPTGASMELLHPAIDNSVGTSWREALTSWGGNDKGTPGFVNSVFDSIPPAVVSVQAPSPDLVEVVFTEEVDAVTGQTIENYMITPDIGAPLVAERDSSNPALVKLTVSSLSEGQQYSLAVHGITDLVGNLMMPAEISFSLADPLSANQIIITEIMKDPSAAGDTDGEWFEVFNTTQQPIDMGGWRIYDGGSNTFTVQGVFVVPPRSFGVFCINTDSASNGGLHAFPMYDWGSSSAFTLGNSDDKIILSADGLVIDSVSYDAGTLWPDLTGASMALSDFTLDNNAGAHWVPATVREPSYIGMTGDLGSPGTLGVNQSVGTGPSITVNPDTIRFTLGRTEPGTTQVNLANIGTEVLTWILSDSSDECSFVDVKPLEGEVEPGGSELVRVRISSEGLQAGTHLCHLSLVSNDPASPLILIPVVLDVVDTAVVGSISIPDSFLPVPTEGDTVEVDITIENLTSRKRVIDAWVTLQRPDESRTRMLIDVKLVDLVPFQELVRNRSLVIPPDYPGGTYSLTLALGDYPDSVFFSSTFTFEKSLAGGVTGIRHGSPGIPESSFLDQSYPSPFNSSTNILYGLSEDTWVTLTVYDMLGREVITLVNEFQFAGYKSAAWDGRNRFGAAAASGTYVYRIDAGDFTRSRTMILLK